MDDINRQEIKSVLQMLALVVPIMVLGFWGFLQSPMYKAQQAAIAESAKSFLIANYGVIEPEQQRYLMEKYGFTDDDINPQKIMEGILTHHDGKIGGLK